MAVNEGKLVVGLFLVILGGLTIILVPLGAKLFAQETQIKLDPESTLFKEAWNAQPFVQDVYLFNVTNPVQVEQFGAKPILRQVGPFCYQAVIRKANVVFHGKNRVAYNPVRQYRFCRECSKFDEDVLITTINIPLVTALQKFRDNDQLLQALIALIKVTGFETMFVTKTAKQLVFEGYRDTLVAGGNLLSDTEKYDNGQFAIYKNHNNTLGPRVVVYTGKHDIDKINTVIALDGRKQLKNWDHASCSSLDGAVEDYTVHPPVDDDEVKVMKLLFLPACRVFSYSLKDDDTIKKYGFTLDSKKFVFDKRNLFNGNDFHGNRCYDKSFKSLESFYVSRKGHLVLPSGVIDVSSCYQNSPILFSLPHFTYADKTYLDSVVGMKPDKKKYESHVYTHPDLGITLTFQLTMQINVGVDVTMFNDKMKPVVLPVSYFVVKSGISKTSTRKLWMGTTLNDTVTWSLSGVTVVIGILVMIAAYLMTDDIQNVRRRPRDSINFPSFSESGTFRAQVDSKL